MPAYDFKLIAAREMDLAGMAGVERATFGSWRQGDFANIIKRGHRTFAYVAVYTDSLGRERVVGFVVLELGEHVLRVLNLAATWPAARKALIEMAEEIAEKYDVVLVSAS